MRLIIAILLITLHSQCQTITITHRDSDDIRISPVPSLIKLGIDSIIISKTGNKIFREYFVYDSLISGLYPGNPDYLQLNKTDRQYYLGSAHFNVNYYFFIPEKPWQRIEMNWRLDSLGNIIGDHYPNCIPDCISDSLNCKFSVDSLEAISIARLNGILVNSIKSYASLSARWVEGEGRAKIVWVVTSTVDNHVFKYLYIDINTRKVIYKGNRIMVY